MIYVLCLYTKQGTKPTTIEYMCVRRTRMSGDRGSSSPKLLSNPTRDQPNLVTVTVAIEVINIPSFRYMLDMMCKNKCGISAPQMSSYIYFITNPSQTSKFKKANEVQ